MVVQYEGEATGSEDECGGARSTQLSVSSEPIAATARGVNHLYHGTWPVERTMWNSEPTNLGPINGQVNHMVNVHFFNRTKL